MTRFTNEQILAFRETCLLEENLHEETNCAVPLTDGLKEALPNFVVCNTWQRFVEEGFEASLGRHPLAAPDPIDHMLVGRQQPVEEG
jgi:hypothetical protein